METDFLFDEQPDDFSSEPQSPPLNIELWEGNGDDLAKRDTDVKWKLGDWLVRGSELAKRDAEVKWELGDWLVEGEPNYPAIDVGEIPGVTGLDFYSVAERITGLARSTLKDLASTARRVSPSVRTDTCSWSHHRALINALPNANEETLREWLTRAANEKMSVGELQKALRPRITEPTLEKSFLVTVPLRVWETLKDFADSKRSEVPKIASQWLVENAELPETQTQRKCERNETRERRREERRRVGLRVAMTYDPLRLRRH